MVDNFLSTSVVSLDVLKENYKNENGEIHSDRSHVDLTPILSIAAKTVQGQFLDRTLTALCDSGSTKTVINQQCLPFGVEPTQGPTEKTTTINGTFHTSQTVMISGIKFPERGNAQIRDVCADIFSSPSCRYDIILGQTELALMQLHLNFTTNTIEWRNHSIPMTPTQQ